jgi:Zn-dependent M28 family amino/carboxypeptidase
VSAKVVVPPLSATGHNVVAKPTTGATCETVTGGHYDSVPVAGGADDNASGTAAVLEVARLAAANDLPGANCFVLFSAEELGLFGSAAYVEMLSDAEVNAMRAMLNIDVVGIDTPLQLIGTDDTVELARVAGDEIGVETVRSEGVPGGNSDHASFIREGIPAVFFNREDPLIHTAQDALGRIEAAKLEDAVRIAYATLEALNGR